MTVVDEIQVVPEAGEIEVRLILPDSLSAETDVLVTTRSDSPLGLEVRDHWLGQIARRLRLQSPIRGMVHGGDALYTIRTQAEGFVEVDVSRDPGVADALENVARLLEPAALRQAEARQHQPVPQPPK